LVSIVDPRRQTVAVHRPTAATQTLTSTDTLDGGPVVPGWTLPIRDIFQ
jgi:hypothetical protein